MKKVINKEQADPEEEEETKEKPTRGLLRRARLYNAGDNMYPDLSKLAVVPAVVNLRLPFETNLMMWLDSVDGLIVPSMIERMKAIREQTFKVELDGLPVYNEKSWEEFKSKGDDRCVVQVVLKKNLTESQEIGAALTKEMLAVEEVKLVKDAMENPEHLKVPA